MNKLTVAAVGIAAAGIVAVPTGLALASAPSFDQSVPVRVPAHVRAVTFDDHGRVVGSGSDDTGKHVEPGDDKGKHVEPGDDKGKHVEPGDDKGHHRGGDDKGHHRGGDDDGSGHRHHGSDG